MKSILEFSSMKQAQQPISMLTCYDYWTAQILNQSNIDCILVGDSVAMVMHGHTNTIPADVDLIALHTKAVVRGAPAKFVIADMPFLSWRKGLQVTLSNVETLMRAGAQGIKIENVTDANSHAETIQYIVESGIPVMGHIGLTVQSIHQLGGFRMQNKGEDGLQKLLRDAKILEQAGCFAIVLECVPAEAATKVTKELKIPTIGIGAGVNTDGQVLVLQDMLGMNNTFKPKFLKTFLEGHALFTEAVNNFDTEVKARKFPTKEHSYN